VSPAGVHSPVVMQTITGDKRTYPWTRRWISAVYVMSAIRTTITIYMTYLGFYNLYPLKYLYLNSINVHVWHNWAFCLLYISPKMAKKTETCSAWPHVCILSYLTTAQLLIDGCMVTCLTAQDTDSFNNKVNCWFIFRNTGS